MGNWMSYRVFYAPGEGGGSAAGAEGAGNESGVTGQDAADQDYGRGADTTPAQESQSAPDEKTRRAAFEKLIREEYPDLYKEKSQKMIQNRLKGAKAAEDTLSKLDPAMRILRQKYGTEDPEALAKAIMDDDSFYEAEAQKRGMDVNTFKLLSQQDARLQQMQEEREQAQQEQQSAQRVMQWRQQEEALKQEYPDFDLDEEIENSGGQLFAMLDRGVDLKTAYRALHFDDIMGQTLAGAVQTTQQRTLDSIRANGMRPRENGAGSKASGPAQFDMRKLSAKDCEALERRAARGEIVTPDKMFG